MQQFPTALTLLSNAAATGAAVKWPGGKGSFTAVGTFSGATISLQYLGDDGVTWVTPTGGSVTVAGGFVFELPHVDIRALVAGGPPSGMYAKALWIPE